MTTIRGIGISLAIFVLGCGSNKTSSTPSTNHDAAAPASDAALLQSDSAQSTPGGAGAPGSQSDVAGPLGTGGSISDAANIINPDASPQADALPLPVADGPSSSVPDGPSSPPPGDAAPLLSGTTLVASTTTPDDNMDPATCSTVALGIQTFAADQTYDIVMPDCHRVSGTITLAGPLPSGAVFTNGGVNAFKIIRDADGRITDTVSYAATVTAVDSTHFRYSMSVPADTYKMMYQFIIRSSALMPSTADRVGEEEITVGQAAIKHDVTLPAIDVATLTATVTGIDALASNGNLSGRMLNVMLLNAGHTLMTSGTIMFAGASGSTGMWVPRETVTPTVMVQESPIAMAPYASGFVSDFKLDPVAPTADFTLPLPPAAKISGTVSDPNHMLIPMMGVGGTGSSGISYYHCDSLDTGTFPNPVFFYPEGSTSNFFSASASHALYVRKGISCVTHAVIAIATGTPGALPTVVGENTYAWLQDPNPQSPNAVTVTTDLIRNLNVPDLGPRVTVTGMVKDARGVAISGPELSLLSHSLSTAAVADKSLKIDLTVSVSGAYTLHILPGTYDVRIALATQSSSTPITPDAGASPNRDAGPDISFSMPDLGAGGTCADLAACCPTLTGTNKTMCDSGVSTGIDATCSNMLSLIRMGRNCL